MIHGPTEDLKDIADAFSRLSRGFIPKLSKGLSKESVKLVKEEQATGTDPEAQPWKPTKRGNIPPLTKSGDMAGSWEPNPGPSSFGLTNPTGYVQFHQTGTSRMPQRKLVPDNHLAGPWGDALEDKTDDIFRSYFADVVK